ncbi:MAG: hypothetical protein LBT59_27480 [Clostridiales bacterium]|nr:hypothetical protein [Clostridiales bacterium]
MTSFEESWLKIHNDKFKKLRATTSSADTFPSMTEIEDSCVDILGDLKALMAEELKDVLKDRYAESEVNAMTNRLFSNDLPTA